MNDLEKYFHANEGRLISKWQHYFEIYDRHFSRFRGTDVCVLEVGIYQGGSLQMWKDYFGNESKIYGVDINPNTAILRDDGFEIFIGDQADRPFLKSLIKNIPRIDILIDDGGHLMEQQIATFEELYSHISSNGVYLCEDLHTSYWKRFGGGYKNLNSYIEYSKNFIDYINAWHSEEKAKYDITGFTKSTYSLHYYDSMLIIEKRKMDQPFSLDNNGKIEVNSYDFKKNKKNIKSLIKRLLNSIKKRLYYYVTSILY